jgi:hypothetical protein
MMTLDVFIRQENISLYKKLLADRNITAGQRDVIGKMLAEEEAKLLNLLCPQEQAQTPPASRHGF